jgi:predicted DNA-binding transcriptional regulator AlpA
MDRPMKGNQSEDGLTNSLLQALLTAPEERKLAALRVLRGESSKEARQGFDAEPYLTLREVGRRLGISACSLWRWGVPGHEMGGRRRFRMSEVEAYLASAAFRRRAEELKDERRQTQASART